jgi:uncharacterized protein YjbI with pentapeptide repeats
MKVEIKNRFNGEVIFSHEQENNSLKITLEVAIKARANLEGANLEWANLEGANLARANLEWANLEGANLEWANLEGANLEGANLARANLARANLARANLEGATYGIATLKNGLFQFLGKYWPVLIFDAHIKIGCQLHSTAEWEAFTDDEISKMASNALEFWKENKDLIIVLAKQVQKCS